MARRSEKKRDHKRTRLQKLAADRNPKAAVIVGQILENAFFSMQREVKDLKSKKSVFVIAQEALRQIPEEVEGVNRIEVDLLNCALGTIARAADSRLNRLNAWPRNKPPKGKK
jgi:hypothetical protein